MLRLLLVTVALTPLIAQDIDTVVRSGGRRASTILDEIRDESEREAYRSIHRATDPLARRSLATLFLQRYPASWLTAPVLEAAAKASIALHDDPAAIYYAKASLRIYPENPSLLAPLAATQARRGEMAAAAENAGRAAEYFRRFIAPANMPDREWQQLRKDTEALAAKLGVKIPTEAPRQANGRYAGSGACRSCHAAEHAAWKQTGMARMFRPFTPEEVIGDFNETTFPTDGAPPAAKMTHAGRNYFFDLKGTSGAWDRFAVTHLIGSKWQQAYVARSSSGQLHVVPLQYNLVERRWLNYWQTIDPEGSARTLTGDFHRFADVTSYTQNCAPCHTSGFKGERFSEAGVNCEMCHGPMAAHAEGKAPEFRLAAAGNREYVDVCAQCHAQSAVRERSAFPPSYRRRPYNEFSRRAFYRDGRFRETTFIAESFERTECFRKGGAHCGHCHDPHPGNSASNPASLKFLNDPNRMCLQCHPAALAGKEHTKHGAGTEGSRCASCHMPPIANSLLFRAASHEMDQRPDAAMTIKFGRKESPNACLLCHAERNDQWLTDQLHSW